MTPRVSSIGARERGNREALNRIFSTHVHEELTQILYSDEFLFYNFVNHNSWIKIYIKHNIY